MALKSSSGSAAASHIGTGSSVYRGSPNYSPLAGYVSGSGSSARSVATTSRQQSGGAAGMADQLQSALDRIYGVTQQNNAWSAQQAQIQRDWQVQQNKVAMEFNAAEAAKNRDWQQMMSDTAHQREIKDLQAAGLNPVLSAMGGNGAAVTSGATASGVTSAGAKGDTDTSFSQALVGLLGTMWSAQTQLESQRLTAQNNMAIAEKNNATSKAIAELQASTQRQIADVAGQYNLSVAGINAATSKLVAQIHAGATVSSASISAAAHRYASELGYSGTQAQVAASLINQAAHNEALLGVAEKNYQSSIESAGIHASSALDVAKENHVNSTTGFAYQAAKSWQDQIKSLFGDRGSFGGSRRGSGFGKK